MLASLEAQKNHGGTQHYQVYELDFYDTAIAVEWVNVQSIAADVCLHNVMMTTYCYNNYILMSVKNK